MSNLAPAAEAATKVITFLAEAESEVGISEISRGVELNKNMVFRILNSLEQVGWVYCRDQKYALTLVPFQVTSKSLSRLNLNAAATPALHRLWELTGESTYLGVLKGEKVCYLQHLDGTGDVRVAGRVGGEYELYCSAPGKAILAYAESEFLNKYLTREFETRTEHTLTSREEILAELDLIRSRGYSTDCEEFGHGITCVAAPIFDYTGKVVGAVGCSSFTVSGQCCEVIERLRPLVCRTAEEISTLLGSPSNK